MTSSAPQTVLITGASGLIGSALTHSLESQGHKVLRAVRRDVQDAEKEIHWVPAAGTLDHDRLEGVDAVVHLAGANIAGKRWTPAYKKLLLESRIQGTALLSKAVAQLDRKPKVFACASAIGLYGDRRDEQLTESSPIGAGFLPEVCNQWEQACQPAHDAGIRVVNMRFGVVLSPAGGALATMLTPFKMGVGGILGSGQQYFSWLALDDAVRAVEFVLATDSLTGPVNLVTPNPVTNHKFTKTLGQALSRPTILPMPAFAARLAFGEMADALLLASARVVPEQLTKAGFVYRYPQLLPALEYLLG